MLLAEHKIELDWRKITKHTVVFTEYFNPRAAYKNISYLYFNSIYLLDQSVILRYFFWRKDSSDV